MSFFRMVLAMIRAPRRRIRRVDAAEAARLRAAGATVIDVREPGERKRGLIPGSLSIPLGDLEARADEIPKDRPVVLHCALGSRSASGAKILAAKGFENAVDLEGGIVAWKKAGLELTRERKE